MSGRFAKIAEEGHANAGRSVVNIVPERHRVVYRLADLLRDGFRFGGCSRLVFAQPLKKDHEFITAEARRGIRLTQSLAQTPGHFDQKLVADIVAARVIEGLEIIEIDQENGAEFVLASTGDHGVRSGGPAADGDWADPVRGS